MDTGRSNLLEALKQVERRTENSASGWRLLFYVVVSVPCALVFIGSYLSPIDGDPRVLRTITVLSVALVAFAVYYASSSRWFVRKRLNESGLAIQIASGELAEDPIIELTPWPWKQMLPGSFSTPDIEKLLQRVAWNLDWYLDRPKRLWRWIWIFQPLVAGLIFLEVFYFLLSITSMRSGINQMPRWLYGNWKDSYAYFASLPFLLLLAFPFIHLRRQIWTEELVRHLRERLEA